MTDTTPPIVTPAAIGAASTPVAGTAAATGTARATGRTVIADTVISKVAGIAARAVPGVHALGGGAARAFGAIRDVVGSQDLAQGVRVEVGETQVAADVSIVVEYPLPMSRIADDVRASVADAIEQLVGMQVAEVNVAVVDVHIAGVDDDEGSAPVATRVV